MVAYYGSKLVSYPISVLLKSYLDSWIGFFGGGGAVNFHNLLSMDGERAIYKNVDKNYSGIFGAVLDAFVESSQGAILISILSYLYVIILRVLGLFGIIEMIKRKNYSFLLVISGLIIYFALTVIFVGTSRYRLPIEHALVILSLYGAVFFKSRK